MLNGFMFILDIKKAKLMVTSIGVEPKSLKLSLLLLLNQPLLKQSNSNQEFGKDIKDLMEL